MSVVSGARRADVVVPGTVPVAELLPALAAGVGLLDPLTAPSGHRLATLDGRRLTGALGLLAQDVDDGALLTVSAIDDQPSRVHDDVVAVVADVVEHDLLHSTPAGHRRTALASAAALLTLAALALATTAGPAVAAVAAGLAAALLGAAVVAARRREALVARVLGWLAVLHSVVVGVLVTGAESRAALVGAGGAAVLAGGAGAVLVDRAVLLPAPVAGAVVAAAGAASLLGGVAPAVTLVVTLALVVATGDLLPWLAATVARLGTGPPLDETPSPEGVDRDLVGAAVRRAHTLLAGLTAAQGLLVAATVPAAVALGPWGALVASAGCGLLLLRACRHRIATTAVVALWSAVGGGVTGAAAAWWWHPEWRLGLAVAAAVVAVGSLVATMLPAADSLRLGRLVEVAEGVVLVSLPPLLVVATGAVDQVRTLVP